MQEGLSIGIYAPGMLGHKKILLAAIRAKRVKQETSRTTLGFDDFDKIHKINSQIVVIETHKPTYLTKNGTVPIYSVFKEVSDSLGRKEIRVIDAASTLQAAVQEKIINGLNVEKELLEFEDDFLLAAPMKYPDLRVEQTIKDNELASLTVRGKLLTSGEKFYSVLTLPAVKFMACGFDLRKGKMEPSFYEVSVPGRLEKIESPSKDDSSIHVLATDMYDEVDTKDLVKDLEKVSYSRYPLSFQEAGDLVAASICESVKRVLKLDKEHSHLVQIPVELGMLDCNE